MSRLASSRLTEARTRSKAAPSAMTASSCEKRALTQALTRGGVTFATVLASDIEVRTMLRATADEPNISSPSSWRERSTEVLMTFWAFFEVQSVQTMMSPAAARKKKGVRAGELSEVIR